MSPFRVGIPIDLGRPWQESHGDERDALEPQAEPECDCDLDGDHFPDCHLADPDVQETGGWL